MHEKANVPFYEVGDTPMIQYVYDLKRKMADYSLLITGKVPTSNNNQNQARKPQPVPDAS